MELKEKFEEISIKIKSLSQKPSNEHLLELYSLYKQATEGDVSGEKPGMFDFVNAAKFNAWEKLSGTSKEGAMEKYIALCENLLKGA